MKLKKGAYQLSFIAIVTSVGAYLWMATGLNSTLIRAPQPGLKTSFIELKKKPDREALFAVPSRVYADPMLMRPDGSIVHSWRLRNPLVRQKEAMSNPQRKFKVLGSVAPLLNPDKTRRKVMHYPIAVKADLTLFSLTKYAGIQKVRHDSSIEWIRLGGYHHEVLLTSEDTIWTFEREILKDSFDNKEFWVKDDVLVEISDTGEVLRRIGIWSIIKEHVQQRIIRKAIRFYEEDNSYPDFDPEDHYDLLHCNSISIAHKAKGSLIAPGDLLVGCLTIRRYFIVSQTGVLKWISPPEQPVFAHSPVFTDEMNIAVFDNKPSEKTEKIWNELSRVFILDPLTNKEIWEFDAKESLVPFGSASRSSVQALRNGNVLIFAANQGIALEVTRDKKLVWHGKFEPTDRAKKDFVAKIGAFKKNPTAQLRRSIDPGRLNRVYNLNLDTANYGVPSE